MIMIKQQDQLPQSASMCQTQLKGFAWIISTERR